MLMEGDGASPDRHWIKRASGDPTQGSGRTRTESIATVNARHVDALGGINLSRFKARFYLCGRLDKKRRHF